MSVVKGRMQVPVMMEFGFVFPPGFKPPAPPPGAPTGPAWQQQVLAKGWGYGYIKGPSFKATHPGA